MSAPDREPRVYVSADPWATGPARWTAWCPWCCLNVDEHRHMWAMAVEDALDHYCAGVQLASLKATLRTRISEWRRRVGDRLELAAASDDPDQYDGYVSGVTVCADDLERAIGGGDD